jgi:hypothetical protein
MILYYKLKVFATLLERLCGLFLYYGARFGQKQIYDDAKNPQSVYKTNGKWYNGEKEGGLWKITVPQE